MNFEPICSLGEEVAWNGKSGRMQGVVIEIHITFNKDRTIISYIIELPNTMHVIIVESSIIKL